MKCKRCGKSSKQTTNKHCWEVAQECGECHYWGFNRTSVSYKH